MNEMTIKIKFRGLLSQKEQIENRRITYTEIQEETGGTPIKTISRWDKGNVTQIHTDVLNRFCDYFDCQVGDLLEKV